MASFRENYRTYTLPENCPSTSLDIHHASESHPSRPYRPPYSRPPSSKLDAQDLKARISYGNKLRQDRKITPRTMGFINWWKERCTAMLHAGPFVRKKMKEEVEILDAEMQSRYDKIHGDDALCHTLVELFDAMAEIRMKADYGDYLAYTCAALRNENMSDLVWKIDKCDWQELALHIEKEEKLKAEQEARRVAVSPTPYLNDINTAATRLGYEYSLVRYQILAYAERNRFCHGGIKGMIDHAEFQELAERIVEDKRSLGVIFHGRPQAQIEMRGVLKMVEKEWFERLYMDETRNSRVRFVLTGKAVEKMRRVGLQH